MKTFFSVIFTLFFALSLGITSMTMSSCSCKDATVLCDLASGAFSAPSTITANQLFDTGLELFNKEDQTNCTSTETSQLTGYLFRIVNTATNQLMDSRDKTNGIPSLVASAKTILTEALSLPAGTFDLEYYADNANTVKERDENNNSGGLKTGRMSEEERLESIRPTNNFTKVRITITPSATPGEYTVSASKPLVGIAALKEVRERERSTK